MLCGCVQVANAYGCGLTDWDTASLYGKLCIFAFAAWAGQSGGVTAGLAVCGVMISVTSAAAGAPSSRCHVDLCESQESAGLPARSACFLAPSLDVHGQLFDHPIWLATNKPSQLT